MLAFSMLPSPQHTVEPVSASTDCSSVSKLADDTDSARNASAPPHDGRERAQQLQGFARGSTAVRLAAIAALRHIVSRKRGEVNHGRHQQGTTHVVTECMKIKTFLVILMCTPDVQLRTGTVSVARTTAEGVVVGSVVCGIVCSHDSLSR